MKLSLFEMVLRAASTGWEGRAKFGQNRAGSARANWVGGADIALVFLVFLWNFITPTWPGPASTKTERRW